jgi:hypothetical protein
MWRAHDHGMRQLWQMDIVGEAASAGQETKILLAPNRLTNAVRHGTRRVHAHNSAENIHQQPSGLFVSGCCLHDQILLVRACTGVGVTRARPGSDSDTSRRKRGDGGTPPNLLLQVGRATKP